MPQRGQTRANGSGVLPSGALAAQWPQNHVVAASLGSAGEDGDASGEVREPSFDIEADVYQVTGTAASYNRLQSPHLGANPVAPRSSMLNPRESEIQSA
jgi:hypothetical protein